MSKTLKKKLGNISDKDNNIVAFLIGQLGRDSSYDRSAISGFDMLQDCYDLIAGVKDIIGGRVILLECKPIEKLCNYYESQGYIDITEENEDDNLKRYIRFIN